MESGMTKRDELDGKMTSMRKLAVVLIALGEFVDGYDLLIIASALIMLKPAFNLTASMTGLLGSIAFIGATVGLVIFGDLTDRLGRRWVYTFNLGFFVIFSLLSAFITNVTELFVLRFLIGVAIGADISASMALLAEISPSSKRGALSGALPQIFWTIGAMASQIVAIFLYMKFGNEAWRWMFGVSVLPAFLLLIGRSFLPESPRWLILKGRTEEAIQAFDRLGLPGEALVQSYSNIKEEKKASYLDLFRPPYTRQAILAFVIVGFSPLFAGASSVVGPYVFRYVGALSPIASLLSGTMIWIGGLIGAIIAFFTVDKIGRIPSTIIACLGSFLCSVMLAYSINIPLIFVTTFIVLAVFTWFGASSFWLFPTELLPTHLRGRAQGFGNGIARLVVAATAVLVTYGTAHFGFKTTIIALGSTAIPICLYALTCTQFEAKNKDLEEVSLDTNSYVNEKKISRN
ncbi:sugar transport proteins signature 2 [Lucifera butyrica]|uniref:Sugar transport proteins signature 2 n=1 Tax=Lucifera butyrica TaxID=1351585 RepID=A0A498R724_9FIRM|nr:MFS transporter [Lucifera butyrica]VBB04928.1 sugar transport proteins signature 2 [Lucifera butyrica]